MCLQASPETDRPARPSPVRVAHKLPQLLLFLLNVLLGPVLNLRERGMGQRKGSLTCACKPCCPVLASLLSPRTSRISATVRVSNKASAPRLASERPFCWCWGPIPGAGLGCCILFACYSSEMLLHKRDDPAQIYLHARVLRMLHLFLSLSFTRSRQWGRQSMVYGCEYERHRGRWPTFASACSHLAKPRFTT